MNPARTVPQALQDREDIRVCQATCRPSTSPATAADTAHLDHQDLPETSADQDCWDRRVSQALPETTELQETTGHRDPQDNQDQADSQVPQEAQDQPVKAEPEEARELQDLLDSQDQLDRRELQDSQDVQATADLRDRQAHRDQEAHRDRQDHLADQETEEIRDHRASTPSTVLAHDGFWPAPPLRKRCECDRERPTPSFPNLPTSSFLVKLGYLYLIPRLVLSFSSKLKNNN